MERGRVTHQGDHGQLRRGRFSDLPEEVQDTVGLARRPGDQTGRHVGANLMKSVDELGDDAEIAASSSQRPEEVRVRGAGSAPQGPVSGHDLHFLEIVDRPPEPPGQVAEPATERQPRHAGKRNEAERRGQTMFLGCPIDVAKRAARADSCQPSIHVDDDVLHPRHVEGHAAVGQREARDVVSAAFDGQLESVVADEVDGPHNVPCGCGLDDDDWPLLDHPVPQLDCLGKTLVVGIQQ